MRMHKFIAIGLSLAMTLQPLSAAAAGINEAGPSVKEAEAAVAVSEEGEEEALPAAENEAGEAFDAQTQEDNAPAAEALQTEEAVEASGEDTDIPETAEVSGETADVSETVEVLEEAAGDPAEASDETAEGAVSGETDEAAGSDKAEELQEAAYADDANASGIVIEGLPEGADPVIAVGATVRMLLDGTDHWESSDPAIAAVSYSGGVVTAIKAGKVSINAYESGGALIGTAEITVTKKMSKFSLSKTYVELAAADSGLTSMPKTELLVYTINPADVKTLLSSGLYFESSDEDVATVDSTGRVTAGEPGSALITCHAGGMKVTCDVVVLKPMEGIQLYISGNDSFGLDNDEQYRLSLTKGEKELLRVLYLPGDTTENQKVTWASKNKSIATVTADGVVEGVKKGSCTITATWTSSTDKKRTYVKNVAVTVTTPLEQIKILNSKKKAVSLVYLNKSDAKITTETLSASLVPADISGDIRVTWGSSNEDVAIVSENGMVTPLKKGFTTITATCQGVESYCVVKVTQNLEKLNLSNKNISLAMGQSMNLDDYVSPIPANCSDPWVLTWKTANKTIVDVEDGVITGIKAGGPVKITVSCGKITDYFNVTVKRVTIGGLIVDNTSLELERGGASKDVVVTAHPGAVVDYKVDNENLVTVSPKDDELGVYQIIPAMNGGAGLAKITFTASYTVQNYNGIGVQKTKSVKVIAKVKDPVSEVHITDKEGTDLSTLQMDCGDTYALWSYYAPLDATDADGVTWKSSKTGVCTVDKNGILKAKGAGDCQISAKIGGITTFLPVTVTRPLVDIRLNKTTLSLKKDGSAKLSVTFNPSNTSVNKGIDWKSSDEMVCTVDGGSIKAVTGGVAVITATSQYDPSFSASCVVNVTVPLTKITYDINGSQNMLVGESQVLTMKCQPDDTTFTLEKVTEGLEDSALAKVLPVWSSSNKAIISVEPSDDGTCEITALKKGSATVKVVFQKKSYSLKFTVNEL